ncbi:hypothetical protein PSTT_12861 [Puccinia striiformis]|uniref:Uncharacterized protein n=1 Tax=Puccinia striiformis TaxID=27350 RepID=A0A2S4UUE2_9BASI|nr:hypothetical protein PSTT_12861 [Puccinia striiformis]
MATSSSGALGSISSDLENDAFLILLSPNIDHSSLETEFKAWLHEWHAPR